MNEQRGKEGKTLNSGTRKVAFWRYTKSVICIFAVEQKGQSINLLFGATVTD